MVIIIFIVVYLLSIWACNRLDRYSECEESILNFIPLINTAAVLLWVIIVIMWYIVAWIRQIGK